MLNRYHISVFSKEANSGNPCIVYLSQQVIAPSKMQSIAAAEAVSETAFIYPDGDCLRLKIYSPWCEMFSCLHATVAACYVLKIAHLAAKLILGDALISFSSRGENISLKVMPIETAKLVNPIDICFRQHFTSAECFWCVTTASGKLRLMVQLSTEQAVTDICAGAIGEVAQSLSDVESFFIYALCSEEGATLGVCLRHVLALLKIRSMVTHVLLCFLSFGRTTHV